MTPLGCIGGPPGTRCAPALSGLPAHAKLQIALPLAGALIGFLGFVGLARGGRHAVVGQLAIALGGLVGGIAATTILYNQMQIRYREPGVE